MTQVILRSPDVIAAEIRSIDQQARQYFLQSATEIGRKLKEAKELVPHGEWRDWLKQNVSYSQSTANNFMRIADEYADSQALANLSYTQAVALLSVPAEERETFVEEHNVKELSSRELQKIIKEKKELEKELRKAKETAELERLEREKIQSSLNEMQQQNGMNHELAKRYKAELEEARKNGDDDRASKIQEKLQQTEVELTETKKKMKELEAQLKAKPIDIPAKEIIEKVPEEVEQELARLKEQVKRNENKAMAKFAVCFDTLVRDFDSLLSALYEIKTTAPEEHEKFNNAVKGLVSRMSDKI
ncbi:DUF3102 domain-containing protein [Paenibacillus campinasensis]|uniref:DUF3102 domain-containing protein n=1 Tax=Paenibacillus campinasensis TaxID=66347 RepID=A0ABW9T8P7_9BACL|nr:DUF3102 domain-containing protein [Paenibacillus campinasensis]MUG68659.1 DUF3102 domain-containing protein [Paenibacillus campinasensis]